MKEDYLDILTSRDLYIAPIYLLLVICIAFLLRGKYTKGQPHIKRYFMPALYVRILGCIASALMYHYYYGGGDTAGYYLYAKALLYALLHDPAFAWEIWFTDPKEYPDYINVFFSVHRVYYIAKGAEMVTIGKIGSVLILFTFKSYLSISFILSLFSFLGCWKLFEVFNMEYPRLHKSIALATLFVPSVFFWGSAGLLKDTIVIVALGYTVWGFYFLFIKKRKKFIATISIILGIFFIVKIKLYVAIALLPALSIWILLKKIDAIKNKAVKRVFFPLILTTGLSLAVGVLLILTNVSGSKFNTDKLLKTVKDTQWWHQEISSIQGGISYELGEWEPTLAGLLPMIPKSINVTLFRPYLWEVRKPILLPSALEGIFALLLTIYVIFKVGIFKILKRSFTDSTLLFCLFFSLFFAFAVGFTTYNFGALARYKIPCLPFYFTALAILLGTRKKRRKIKKEITLITH